MWEKYGSGRQVTDNIIQEMHFYMPDNWARSKYTQSSHLKLFSTALTVTRTHLKFTLCLHWLYYRLLHSAVDLSVYLKRRNARPLSITGWSVELKKNWRLETSGMLCFLTRALQPKAYCAIWVRRSNFRHQASPRVSQRESTQRRKVELWARNIRKFCLNADCRVTFRDYDMGPTALLPLRRKACWGFFLPKNPKASAGCEPANLGTKGQHATSRPRKPHFWDVTPVSKDK